MSGEAFPHGSWRRRFGAFGDLPTRWLVRGLRGAPWFAESILIAIWTLFFFLAAKDQREAVVANLRALFPDWTRVRAVVSAYRVFLNFAGTYVDGQREETGTGGVDWSIEGLKHFEALRSTPGGCLILTAHMGNYDMAAPLFSAEFGRPVYAVRAPEREPEMQVMREQRLRENERRFPLFRNLYNLDGEMLGVELARLLGEGNVVAVQGDRVLFEVSGMAVEVEPGLRMSMPRGPLFLARAAAVPVYPLFIIREGWRRYRVKVLPRLDLPKRQRGEEDTGAQVWAEGMFEVLRPHWAQWFVFEPVFERAAVEGTGGAA